MLSAHNAYTSCSSYIEAQLDTGSRNKTRHWSEREGDTIISDTKQIARRVETGQGGSQTSLQVPALSC